MRSEARLRLITPALADVKGQGADNGLETGMSAADIIPPPSTSEEGAPITDLSRVFEIVLCMQHSEVLDPALIRYLQVLSRADYSLMKGEMCPRCGYTWVPRGDWAR